MPTINENFLKLEKNYLFINIAKKVNAFLKEHPEADLIRMGIGDVTLPIAPVCVEAMKKGADEMGVKETFKGYEDSGTGYDFLKPAGYLLLRSHKPLLLGFSHFRSMRFIG